jgi:hypothetical protein
VFVVVDEPPPVSVELESSSFEQEIVKIVTNAKIVALKKFVFIKIDFCFCAYFILCFFGVKSHFWLSVVQLISRR